MTKMFGSRPRSRTTCTRPRRTIAWISWAAVGSLGGCFRVDATRGLPCTDDDACGSLSCEYGICGGPTRCEAGAGVGDYCYVLTDEAFPVGEGPVALAIADVNADLVRDIVTADGGSRGVSVLLGDGAGGFASHELGLPELASPPTTVGLGHLDGVGWADIAIVTEAGNVHAALIGEAGVLDAVAAVASPVAHATRPTIADFVQDGAGARDIAVLGEDGVFVARNVDLSTFESTWRATMVDNPRDMLTIQDAAGDPAFAYVARVSDDDISSLSRKADGTFSTVQSIPVGDGPVSFAISDLNSDDYADALVVSSTGSLWLTKGKSANRDEWSPPERLYDLGWVPDTLDVLDLDDDGDPDVVVSGRTPDGHSDVFLLENDGEGGMIYGGSLGLRDASAAALADLDSDGVPEVVIAAADDGAVRLARRAKAPPMPGDDDGTVGDTTAASMSSVTVADSGDDVTGTSFDDGPVDTGVDPTGPEDCTYFGSVGIVELARCTPIGTYGYHQDLAFALVDEDYYDDIVAVVSDDNSGTRLVGFCSEIGYGYAGGLPQMCMEIPLPGPATGLAGGTFTDGTPAIAVTHESSISLALSASKTGMWNLADVQLSYTEVADPRFYDLAFDAAQALMVRSAEGIVVSQPTAPMPQLVFAGAGSHDPRGHIAVDEVGADDGPGLFSPEIVFALEDVDGSNTTGALMVTSYDPENMGDSQATPVVEHPSLVGLREVEFVFTGPDGLYMLGVVGEARNLAVAFGGAVGEPQVYVDTNFAEISELVIVGLDADPLPDDVVLIGSFLGGPSAVHVIVDDAFGEQEHLELLDLVDAYDLATWSVPCGPQSWLTEVLVSMPYGIERIRAVNTCG